jgi:hypothetical protein
MADSVNRIVPTSLPLDPATQLGKERGKNKRGDSRRQKQDEVIKPSPSEEDNRLQSGDVTEAEENKTKGKKLDISA